MLVSFYGLEVRQVQSGSRQVGMKNKTRTVKRTEKVQKLLVIIKNINDDGINIYYRARCFFSQLAAKNMSKQTCWTFQIFFIKLIQIIILNIAFMGRMTAPKIGNWLGHWMDFVLGLIQMIFQDITHTKGTTITQNFKMSKFQNVKVSKCQNFKMSKFQNVKISKCQNVKISKFRNFKISILAWIYQSD